MRSWLLVQIQRIEWTRQDDNKQGECSGSRCGWPTIVQSPASSSKRRGQVHVRLRDRRQNRELVRMHHGRRNGTRKDLAGRTKNKPVVVSLGTWNNTFWPGLTPFVPPLSRKCMQFWPRFWLMAKVFKLGVQKKWKVLSLRWKKVCHKKK